MLRVLLIPIALAGLIACQPRDPKPADSPADPPAPMSSTSQTAPSASRVGSNQGAMAISTVGLSC